MLDAADSVVFRPRRLGHVNLWVSDIKRSERFYNETCGLAVEFTEPGLVATFLGTGHTPHDLGMIEKTDGKPRYGRDGLLQLPPGIGLRPGLNHIAWEVHNEAELVDGFRRLEKTGVKAHLTVDHQVAHSIYVADPDGNESEYYCDTIKDWRSKLGGEMDLITSAWTPGSEEPFTDPRWDDSPTPSRVNAAPVHPHRLTHAVLMTRDVARLADFYRRIGGLETAGNMGTDAVMLRGSLDVYPFNLAICAGDEARYHHASFELESEAALDAAEQALAARGVTPERRVDLPWKRSFFLVDPDGMLSEYYVSRPGRRDAGALAGVPLPFAI